MENHSVTMPYLYWEDSLFAAIFCPQEVDRNA